MRKHLFLLLALAFLCVPLVAAAQTPSQTTINPKSVEFTASPDHSAVIGDQTVLQRYELRIFLKGATDPFQKFDLGKPTPDANNKILVTNPAWFVALAMKTEYFAKVAAIGLGAEGVSDASNPFGNVGPMAAPSGVAVR